MDMSMSMSMSLYIILAILIGIVAVAGLWRLAERYEMADTIRMIVLGVALVVLIVLSMWIEKP